MGAVRNMWDGLANLVTGLGTRADARTARFYADIRLNPQQIMAAYEQSWSLRKAINVPASDRVRSWRDWQAEADQIEAIEAEERRHQLPAKVKQCEVLRGLGGGAMILVTAGNTEMPINSRAIKEGGLVAVNVVSRWQITGQDWIDDLASPDYGTPRYWTISGKGGQTRLHPSRVVCFRGEPLPSFAAASLEEQFWGRGRVPSLMTPAMDLDEALASFAALIKDARNIDIGVPKLLEMVSTAEGEANLMKRLGLMAQGTSIVNANVYDAGDGEGKGGEKIDRHQVTWTGIPEIIRVYAEALSAASDIPVTRLWGTSPKGLNATGEGDANDFNKMIETGQTLELRPCLDQIDEALIPSALGSRPPEIWWKFGALDVPSEKENAERFKVTMEAVEKVQATGAIPDIAFAKGFQNLLSENGWVPGLEGALAELPEDERFGLSPEFDPNEPDPSALTQQPEGGDPRLAGGAGGDGSAPARRAANDALKAAGLSEGAISDVMAMIDAGA